LIVGILKVFWPNPGTSVPVKWSAEYIKHDFPCNNYFHVFCAACAQTGSADLITPA
jgi:hypothetical protein